MLSSFRNKYQGLVDKIEDEPLNNSVIEKQEVKGGIVVEVGPGIPLGSPDDGINEPWKENNNEVKYIPTQAEIGDYALYLGKAGIEIEIEKKEYLIVPQSAILILIRDDIDKIVS